MGFGKSGAEGKILSICNSIGLQFGQKEFYLTFCCYLHQKFFNQQRFRAEGNSIFPTFAKPCSLAEICWTEHNYRSKIGQKEPYKMTR